MSKTHSRRSFLKISAIGAAGLALAACQGTSVPTTAPGATNTPAVTEGEMQPATATPAVTEGEAQKATAAPAATEPPKEGVAPQKQKITFTMYGHPTLVEQMVPLFNESQPDVEVQFERSEGQGYWEKLSAAVAAGTAWDCFRGDVNRALGWGPKGAVLDVSTMVESDQKYPRDDYLPGILDVYTVNGKVYGVPTWCLTMWMYYNKKMFDAASIAYPTAQTTWDEYVEMAKKLTKREGDRVTQFGANGWSGWTFPVMQVVWSNGGKFYYSDDMTKIAVDDPKTIEALQDLADLALVDKVSPDPTTPQSSPVGILSDNVATQGDGDYLPMDNKDVFMEKYEYIDATLAPTRAGKRVNIYWPDCFEINAKTQAPEACYKWISWFARDPAATAIQCKVVFPVYKKAYDDDAIAKTWLVEPRPKGMIAAARDHVKDARLYKVDLHINDIDTIYYNEIGKLWSGEAKADEVAKRITDLGNEAMAKPVDVQIK